MNIKPESILKRSNEVQLRLDSFHRIEVIVKNKRRRLSNHALGILNVFSHPLSLQQAIKILQTNGVQDWIELTDTIKKLCQLGALIMDSDTEFVSDKNPESFGAAPIHIAMLNDRRRTDSFITAINATVKEGDVVVDIGTGTGVLAIAAARAGAKKVYAIEASAMAEVAQAVINTTEVADKITVIRGWSIQIELPERADVLISEIIGNDPFGEKVMQTFIDARQRLLQPDARILPGSMKVYGLPVEIPGKMLTNRLLSDVEVEDWKQWYGIDFSALKNIESFADIAIMMLKTEKARRLKACGEPILLTETDFGTFEELKIEKQISIRQEHPYNGLLIYFELNLGANILSNSPEVADLKNSWTNPVWYLPGAEKIAAGEDYILEFSYGDNNDCQIHLVNTVG